MKITTLPQFQEIEEQGTIPNSFCEAKINLVLNLDLKSYGKKVKVTGKYPS